MPLGVTGRLAVPAAEAPSMKLLAHRSHRRTDAQPRRSGGEPAAIVVDSLVVDVANRKATRHGRHLDLQPRQFELLVYLARRVGQVVTRPMLAKAVWKDETATWTNVITVNVCMLRRELERPGQPTILHTVRGRGYRLGERGGPKPPLAET